MLPVHKMQVCHLMSMKQPARGWRAMYGALAPQLGQRVLVVYEHSNACSLKRLLLGALSTVLCLMQGILGLGLDILHNAASRHGCFRER